MALIPCPGCGRQISEYARTCPGCGFALIPDRSASAAVYPPAWPDDARRVLPWAAVYFSLGAVLVDAILWRRSVSDSLLWVCWASQIAAAAALSCCLAGTVFRSCTVLLAALVALLAAAVLGFFGRLYAAGILALLAATPLAVFLLLELIRRHKHRKGLI